MNEHAVKVNNKMVDCSLPYVSSEVDLVGREKEMQYIMAAWMAGNDVVPQSPLLESEPGFGKNVLVYECCRLCGKKLYIFQGNADVRAEDFVYKIRPSNEQHKKWDFTLTPLTTAMIRGEVCLIDEIGKIRPEGLALLVSLLDDRRYIDATFFGERIYAHPGFRLIAATNPYDLEVNPLPKDILSRLRPVITLRSPSKEEIEKILKTRYRVLRNDGREMIDHFWHLWGMKNTDKPPTPRESIKIFAQAINFADYEAAPKTVPFELEKTVRSSAIAKRHLKAAFDLFHNGGNGTCI